ncbi:MAG TPA: hypothetical protein VKF40_04145 [Burkholderiales bacterium]|nr:hypothetical protein [Burkholderiales bacterium]
MELNTAPERFLYARVLAAGMRSGLTILTAGSLAYALAWLPVRVPFEELPSMWALPAPEYLKATGMPTGWNWIVSLHHGDTLPLLGIAILAGVPLAALAVLVPFYARRRDWVYLFIAVLQIGVIVLAASGVLAVVH